MALNITPQAIAESLAWYGSGRVEDIARRLKADVADVAEPLADAVARGLVVLVPRINTYVASNKVSRATIGVTMAQVARVFA